MSLQLIRLLKAAIRGEKLREEIAPSQKIWHKPLNAAVVAAAPGVLTFPTGRIKKVVLTYDSGPGFGGTVINFGIGNPLIPSGASVVATIAGINYFMTQLNVNGIGQLVFEWDNPQAVENPTIPYYFGAGSGGANLEVHYE